MGALLGLAIALPDRSVDSSLFTQLFTRLILFGHFIAPTRVVEQFLVTVSWALNT